MAFIASLVLDAGQLIATMVPALAPQPDVTKVQILVGQSNSGGSLSGNSPYVTIFDNLGNWMGTHKPKNRNKVWDEGSTSKPIKSCLAFELVYCTKLSFHTSLRIPVEFTHVTII